MKHNELSFANFICTFGENKYLLDFAKEIVLPAFLNDALVRKYGDTHYYYYDTKLSVRKFGDATPLLILSGHFVKDTVLKREQIFDARKGLVSDYEQMRSAPSAYFILILNNHRLLYFPETSYAPSLSNFQSTTEHFMRKVWRKEIATLNKENGVSIKELRKSFPQPRLKVIPTAGEQKITDVMDAFDLIKEIKLRLIKPNHEVSASDALQSVEDTFRPLNPKRLDIIVAEGDGLENDESIQLVAEAAETDNTEILVKGVDEYGNRLKAENSEFALTTKIDDVPDDDDQLIEVLMKKYEGLAADEIVKPIKTSEHSKGIIAKLMSLL